MYSYIAIKLSSFSNIFGTTTPSPFILCTCIHAYIQLFTTTIYTYFIILNRLCTNVKLALEFAFTIFLHSQYYGFKLMDKRVSRSLKFLLYFQSRYFYFFANSLFFYKYKFHLLAAEIIRSKP